MYGMPRAVEMRPVVTWTLLAVNLVLWLAMEARGGSGQSDVLLDFGAIHAPYVSAGEYWRLLTSIFLHAGLMHLLFNSIGLLLFGRIVERLYGHVGFAVIYLLAGVGGGIASFVLNPITVGAGASGAIFGIVGAFAAFFFARRHVLGDTARQTLSGVGVLLAINLAFGFMFPQVDNWAHLGGLVVGSLVGLAIAPQAGRGPLYVSYGQGYRRVAVGIRPVRWLLLAAVASIMAAGVMVGKATMPDNSASRIIEAERLIEDGLVADALVELLAARELAIRERNGRSLAEIGQLLSTIR